EIARVGALAYPVHVMRDAPPQRKDMQARGQEALGCHTGAVLRHDGQAVLGRALHDLTPGGPQQGAASRINAAAPALGIAAQARSHASGLATCTDWRCRPRTRAMR